MGYSDSVEQRATRPSMLDLTQCGHCGTRDCVVKKCMRCRAVAYCGKGYAPPSIPCCITPMPARRAGGYMNTRGGHIEARVAWWVQQLNSRSDGRCQTADWKGGHKKLCIPLQERGERCAEAIRFKMPAAEALWDSRAVIKTGLVAEKDFEVCKIGDFDEDAALRREHATIMGRAYSRQGDYAAAMGYFDKFIAVCVETNTPRLQARGLCLKAEMQVHLRQLDGARLSYEHAQTVGEEEGLFEVYSKTCVGLSAISRLCGDTKRGLELATEGLAAVGLTEPGDYAKKRDEARAISAIISCSNVDAVDFDETLLERLTVLGVEVDEDPREGGSTISINAASLRGARHFVRMRFPEAIAAYAEVVEMAKEARFAQQNNVQKEAARALFQIILCSP
jgi:tetratricopeptide (TPR) repeat protein